MVSFFSDFYESTINVRLNRTLGSESTASTKNCKKPYAKVHRTGIS